MSDISYEQMKVLFENLADRIDKTGGDKATQEALDRVQKVMNDTLKSVEKMTRQGTADSKAIQKVLNDFVVEFSRNAPRQPAPTGPRQPHRPYGAYGQHGSYRRPGIQTRNHAPTQQDDRSGDTYIRRKKAEQDNDLRGLHDHSKAQGESTNSIMRLKKGIDSLHSGITGFLGRAKSDGFLSAVAGGGVAGSALGVAKDRAEAYRALIASGDGQISSIQQMNNTANDAIMSVQDLAKAMTNGQGATGARLLGASDYSKLTAVFTKNNAQLANLGLTFQESQDITQNYLDIQKNQGAIRNRSADEMAAGIADIKKSSEESANILGITREEALKAAKDEAADPMATAIFKGMGFDPKKITSINMDAQTLEKLMPGGSDLYKTGAMGSEMASTEMGRRMQQLSPALAKEIMDAGKAKAAGRDPDMKALTARLQSMDDKDAKFNGQLAFLGRYNSNGVLGEAIKAKAQSSIELANANTEKQVPHLENAGTNAALGLDGLDRSARNAARGLEDLAMNSMLNTHGKQLNDMVNSVREGLDATNGGLRTLQGFPQTVAVITESLLGLAAVVGTASVVFKGFSTVKSALGFLGGGAGAAGADAGAAGGAGGAAAGGTFISRMLAGGKNVAGKALGSAAGMGKSSALISSLFEAGSYFTDDKSFSMKNLAKSGLRVGGSVLGTVAGGALGSMILPGFGTAAGAIGGGYAGNKAGDWLAGKIFGDDDHNSPANASNDPRTQAALQQQMAKQDTAADATGNRTPGMLSPYQMNQRLMEASERAAGLLQSIKDNSDQQVGLLREELGLTRAYGERMSRLLEETSRNTRQIAEHSA